MSEAGTPSKSKPPLAFVSGIGIAMAAAKARCNCGSANTDSLLSGVRKRPIAVSSASSRVMIVAWQSGQESR